MEAVSISTNVSTLAYVTLMPCAPIPMDLTLVELARLDTLELELLDVPQCAVLLAKMVELALLLILALALLDLLELHVNLALVTVLEMYLLLPLGTKTWNRAQLKPLLLLCA
jgi:hypothetical protein